MDKKHIELIEFKMKSFSPSSKIIEILEKTESYQSDSYKEYYIISKSDIPNRKIQIISGRIINNLYAEFRVVSQ